MKNMEISPPSQQKQLYKESVLSQPQLARYRKSLFYRIMIGFIFCFLLVCERVFRSNFNLWEISALESIQSKLQASFNLNEDFRWLYRGIGYLGDFKFYCLIMTHLFVSMYVSIDAIIGLKCLFVHCISFYLLTLLELFYQGARPFWVSENIIAFFCDNSYTNPSVLTFGFFFDGSILLALYLKKAKEIKLLERVNLDEEEEEEIEENHDKITFFLKVLVVFGILVAHVLLLLRYIIGLLFICDYVMGLIYFAICFTIVGYFDFYIDKLIKSSTVLKKKARGMVFGWIVFLILSVLLAYVIFLCSGGVPPIFWLNNYMNCIVDNKIKNTYIKQDVNYLLGSYPTFIQTSIVFGLVAGILGAQMCFNFIPNINWYKGSVKMRTIRFLIVNIMMIPSWVWSSFQDEILAHEKVRKAGISDYVVDVLHFAILFFVLYGVLPIFMHRIKLAHKDVKYSKLIQE